MHDIMQDHDKVVIIITFAMNGTKTGQHQYVLKTRLSVQQTHFEALPL